MNPLKIIEWLKLPTQHLFSLFLFFAISFAVLVFASDAVLETLGLRDFRSDYRLVLGLGLILSSAALITRLINSALDPVKTAIRERRSLNRRRERLRSLTPEERDVLRPYIQNDTRTQYLKLESGIVSGLQSVGIIYRSANIGNLGGWAYNIQPWAWDYLKEHPEFVVGRSE